MSDVKIGGLTLSGAPRLAVPLLDDDIAGDIAAVRDLADLIELRIDSFANREPKHVRAVAERARDASDGALPIIATVRAIDEGGAVALDDETRCALYAAALPAVDAVDVELAASARDRVLGLAREHRRATIVSFHDFGGTPEAAALDDIAARIRACGADVIKVACKAHGLDDVVRLLEFTLHHRAEPLVTMSIGPLGAISRVFFPLAGSRITFGYHRTPSAPGQMPLAELRAELARYYPGFGT